nr:MAG TPA: helix-turn-helix domain protein [Caudoviricetes sp.]
MKGYEKMLFYNDLFKKFRESKCFTLEEIGKRIGVSKQTVQKWEAGIANPRPSNVYALAKILEISAVDISDLRPEKWLTDSVEQKGIGNVAINGRHVGVTISGTEQIEAFRSGLIAKIIMLDIEPVAKDAVLKVVTSYRRREK